jgi:hypothetical protein
VVPLILPFRHRSLIQFLAAGVLLVTLGGSLLTSLQPGSIGSKSLDNEALQINENRIRQSAF